MAARKKNLLEAFSNAGADTPLTGGAQPRRTPEAPSTPPVRPVTSAPAAPPSVEPAATVQLPPDPRRQRTFEEEARAVLAGAEKRDPATWVPLLAAALIAFVAGLFVGRLSSAPATLAAPGEAPGESAGPNPAAGLVPGTSRDEGRDEGREPETLGQSPLMDKANQYTVVVQTYGPDREDYAWATYDHLRDEGVSAFPPLLTGSRTQLLVVLAGAAPRSADLRDLETRIQGLSRNGRRNVYSDAYREKIDDLIER